MILYRVNSTQNMYRWYFVAAQPTLFEAWAVVLGWGRIGTDYARWKIIPVENQVEADELARQIKAKKIQRGYCPKP